MRTDSFIMVTPSIAVITENLEAIRETVMIKPLPHVSFAYHPPVFPSTPIDMIDSQEEYLCLATARTSSSIMLQYSCFQFRPLPDAVLFLLGAITGAVFLFPFFVSIQKSILILLIAVGVIFLPALITNLAVKLIEFRYRQVSVADLTRFMSAAVEALPLTNECGKRFHLPAIMAAFNVHILGL